MRNCRFSPPCKVSETGFLKLGKHVYYESKILLKGAHCWPGTKLVSPKTPTRAPQNPNPCPPKPQPVPPKNPTRPPPISDLPPPPPPMPMLQVRDQSGRLLPAPTILLNPVRLEQNKLKAPATDPYMVRVWGGHRHTEGHAHSHTHTHACTGVHAHMHTHIHTYLKHVHK